MATAAAVTLLQRLQQAQASLQTSRPRKPSSAVDFFSADLTKASAPKLHGLKQLAGGS